MSLIEDSGGQAGARAHRTGEVGGAAQRTADAVAELRPFAPLQIIHGAASDAALSGQLGPLLDRLVALGLGGIVVNYPANGYLRAGEGWEPIRQTVCEAAARGMRVWLYDEEGYPSGAAGGMVLGGRPELEASGVSWAWLPLDEREGGAIAERWRAPALATRLLGAWRFPMGADGEPSWTKREFLTPEDWSHAGRAPADAGAWRVGIAFERRLYEGTHAERNFHASRRMINVIHADSGQAFVRATHERYATELGPLLRRVEAVFTDEPSWISAFVPALGLSTQAVRDPLSPLAVQYPALPWAPDLEEAFRAEYRDDLLPGLPLLFVDFAGVREEARRWRARFQALVTRLYGERYFEPIRAWSRDHGLASSGHVLAEEGLVTHAAFQGDLMAQLRRLDWPGCDVLSTDPAAIPRGDLCLTARFAASVARLTGAPQVMCEISDHEQRHTQGVPATTEAMLGTAFALCTLGVSVYCSYYAWDERGERADYRAWCLGAARACQIIREWESLTDVALFYPIRAIWEEFRPSAEVFQEAVRHDPRYLAAREVSARFGALARALLQRQIAFDILDEEAVASSRVESGADGRLELVCAGRVRYRVVVLPPGSVLTPPLQAALQRWAQAGGPIVAAGPGGLAPAVGAAPLEPSWVARLERLDGAAPEHLAARLRALAPSSPPLVVVEGDGSAVLAAAFRHPDGRSGYMLTNTAAAPLRVVVDLPGVGPWLATDLATGEVQTLRPQGDGVPGRAARAGAMSLRAYGGVWVHSVSR